MDLLCKLVSLRGYHKTGTTALRPQVIFFNECLVLYVQNDSVCQCCSLKRSTYKTLVLIKNKVCCLFGLMILLSL